VAAVAASVARADLVSWYKFDGGSGTVAVDSSGHGNDGTLKGGAAWAAGKLDGAIQFNGTDAYVETQRPIQDSFTLAAWIKTSTAGRAGSQAYEGSGIFWSDVAGTANDFVAAALGTKLSFFCGNPDTSVNSIGDIVTGEWVHIACVRDVSAKTIAVYINGALDKSISHSNVGPLNGNNTLNIGGNTLDSRYFTGLIDDVKIFDTALAQPEIAAAMRGQPGLPGYPSPTDRATDVPRDATFGWKPGQFAKTHDVYLGTGFEDVNTATRADPKAVLVSRGQDANAYDPAGLFSFGQTYYWRVDEVNAAPDSTIFQGDVWSFTAEPYGYPVKPVKATASSMLSASMGPDKTIDGSGMDALDQHSVSASHMWLSKKNVSPIWIQYEFDRVYKLYQMWVWNSNQASEVDIGFGAKDVKVETSADGTTWTALADVPEFAQAPGEPNYVHNTTVDFKGVQAKYVKLTINTNWADGTKQAGLAEVRFFYVPVKAFSPTPAPAATGVAIDSVLNWRPGREAARHDVYLSGDASAVANGTALVATTTDHGVSLANLGLEYGRTYTWKVNEVNDAATPKSWEGDLWTFQTPDYGIVDDFESYNDQCNRIFFAWVDGYGYSESPNCGLTASAGNGSGSTVGNTNPPFAEKTIVNGGRQAMPLAYDNTTGKNVSEATRTFVQAQDWTRGGAKVLMLFFRGRSDNGPGQLYVVINGTRVTYDGSAAAVTIPVWKQWNINLAAVGTNLKAVKTLAIGVSGAGKGTLYVDDIRLYRDAPAPIQAADPGTNGLALWYRMDGNVKDSSGKGLDGTAVGNPSYVEGPAGYGQALQFEGIDDEVDVPIGTLISTLTSATFATWVNDSGQDGSWTRIFDFGTGNTNYVMLTPHQGATGPLTCDIVVATAALTVPQTRFAATNAVGTGWHHVAVVFDAAAMNAKIYEDGMVVASGVTTVLPKDLGKTTQNWLGRSQFTADAYLSGILDEFRIYSRALSAGEIRYLCGDR
jgi:hypothetical protein